MIQQGALTILQPLRQQLLHQKPSSPEVIMRCRHKNSLNGVDALDHLSLKDNRVQLGVEEKIVWKYALDSTLENQSPRMFSWRLRQRKREIHLNNNNREYRNLSERSYHTAHSLTSTPPHFSAAPMSQNNDTLREKRQISELCERQDNGIQQSQENTNDRSPGQPDETRRPYTYKEIH